MVSGSVPAVLTSDVINEAQTLFQQRSAKKEGMEPLVSQNDVLYILRAIGMNPTQKDLEELISEMAVYDPEEKKDNKKKKKEEDKKDAKKKEEEDKDKVASTVLPEDIPKFAWLGFIEAVELGYRNPRRCEEQIIDSFKVFDQHEPTGNISLKDLIDIMTRRGDDVLSPVEVDELRRLFAGEGGSDDVDVDFAEFAKTMLDGQRPPPPPPPPEESLPGSRKQSQAAS